MEATVTPTTGTTTTAAPAPVATPVAPSTPAERPTFAQAFASDAAPSPQPAQPEAPTTQAADAAKTTAPVHPSADAKTGEPPQEKWPQILENARTKAIAEYKEKVGWAETVDRTAYEEAARIGQLYQRDKPAYLRQVMAEALANPELAPLVRSEAARVLASRQAAAPQAIEPDIPVVDESGRVVAQAFSAERVKSLIAQAVQEAIGKEVGPLKQDRERQQQAEQARQEQAQLQKTVVSLHERALSEMPHFKEHEQEIAAAFDKIPGEPEAALYRAWMQVVLPKLNATSQAQALDDLKTKAAASIANPASAAVATTKRPRSFNDPSLKW